VKPGDPGHDPAAIVELRKVELAESCKILGVDHLELLEYADSGMMGWPQNDVPHSFWHTPVDDGAKRLGELIDRYQPDVIVTYDENGFYGHPDHIQAHRITMAAVELTNSPAKVYWTTVPRSMFEKFEATVRELGGDWDDELPDEDEVTIGLPDEEITTWVDIAAYGEQKFTALAAHASQGENIFFLQMGQEKFIELMGTETFVRVKDNTGAAVPETDLFDGLR
jgi:LmbE family N-acetylglucosaminyl deacetylase